MYKRQVYGQLKEPEFAVGDYVEAGHVIGYVTEPAKYYCVEGSNLYFELRKDGEMCIRDSNKRECG